MRGKNRVENSGFCPFKIDKNILPICYFKKSVREEYKDFIVWLKIWELE